MLYSLLQGQQTDYRIVKADKLIPQRDVSKERNLGYCCSDLNG